MEPITTVGLDIAKSVFQIHGIDAAGKPVVRRQLKRRQVITFFRKLEPCLVSIEACSSSHHWARELMGLGHDVRLMPPAYVKPYLKRHKNDATDAEAICEAVQHPNVSKQGDRYLRSLFTVGALAVIKYAKKHGTEHRAWLARLLDRRPTRVAACVLANKLARMAWAMMASGETYREPAALAK